jgi:hypothetical protein
MMLAKWQDCAATSQSGTPQAMRFADLLGLIKPISSVFSHSLIERRILRHTVADGYR